MFPADDPEKIADLAKSLWYMFAVGPEANRWDDKAMKLWLPKATKVADIYNKEQAKRG